MSASALHNHLPNMATTTCPACMEAVGRFRIRDEDVWNLDGFLAAVIAEGVERLRVMDHGYPADLTPEKWQLILTEIAEGFRAYAEDEDFLGDDYAAKRKRLDRSFKLLRKWFESLWD